MKPREFCRKFGDPKILDFPLYLIRQNFRAKAGEPANRAVGSLSNSGGKVAFVTDQDDKPVGCAKEILGVGPVAGVFHAGNHFWESPLSTV